MTWDVPDWYAVALLAFAAYRVWYLLAHDTILDPVRRRLVRAESKQEEFLQCPFCAGFWVALAWLVAWQIWPHGSLVAAALFAISALVALVATHDNTD